jgi:phospholipase/carboxylesterase
MPAPLVYAEQPPRQSSANPPLLLLLHGYGANEHDLLGLGAHLDPRFHCVSPQAPLALPWGGYAWYGIDFSDAGTECRFEQAPAAQESIESLLDSLKAKINPSQVFLLGFSQGGGMAINIGLRRHQHVTGIVSLSGLYAPPLQPGPLPELAAGYPIFMSHGRQDPVLPIERGRQARALLDPLPIELDYREYDMAHEIDQACLSDVQQWLADRLD